MSKERAVRRAAREAELAEQRAERERGDAERARRLARRTTFAKVVPRPLIRSSSSTGGVLAARRRRRVGLLAVGFVVVQVLTWAWTPDWGVRVAVIIASLFAIPVVAVLSS
ncbi:MAG: hypothetical protein M3423_07280 [Actinomycetota bacterium]|nr:hypothetical protein [Nocardioidaceae bacterium]MDQ3481115.1 hypothetical protein [Actinomycetota bacterium]